MGKIRQLDQTLANKIAAGEVVERPASVIKELVENSIDANASQISILIEEGGTRSMTIIDNGIGMSEEDALMCFSTHATSKIADEHDLFNIHTLGFRGEAIPSIASISRFTLETSDGNENTKVIYEFGKKTEVASCTINKGTKITVERIFQNVPARLKYLKSVNAEFAAIYTFVERLALANPQISFILENDGKTIFQTNGNGNLLEVIAQIYGIATAKNMIPVDIENEEFSIHGFISKIDTTRASKNHIVTLINHRFVKNTMSINAINEVYRKYLADKRFPVAILNINVDPYLVDVNVHPSKLEVRFSKEMALKELIIDGLSKALMNTNLTYQVKNKVTERETFKPQYDQAEFVLEQQQTFIESVSPNEEKLIKEVSEIPLIEKQTVVTESIVKDQPTKYVPTVKPLKEKIFAKGQIRGTYLIGENEKGMYLVDQHAAQERINYEYYLEQFSHLDLSMQPLLVPITFEFPKSEFLILDERKSFLENVGIFLEEMPGNTYMVRNLPLWIRGIDETIFIEEMINEVLSKNQLDVVKLQEHAIATLSCKASLKANTYLNMQDMQMIFDNLMRCDNPYVCPHGRPTIIFYSDYDLEKIFKRVV